MISMENFELAYILAKFWTPVSEWTSLTFAETIIILEVNEINPYRNWSIRDLVCTKLKYTRLKYTIYDVYEIGFTVIGRYTELKVYEMSRHHAIHTS